MVDDVVNGSIDGVVNCVVDGVVCGVVDGRHGKRRNSIRI